MRIISLLFLIFFHQVTTAQENQKLIDGLFDKAYELETTSPDSALSVYKTIDSLSVEGNDIIARARANHYSGIVYFSIADYTSSILAYQKAIELYKSIDHQKGIAGCNLNMGNVYWAQGNYTKALSHYIPSVSAFESLNDSASLVMAYNNLGSSYRGMNDPDKALQFHEKAKQISIALNDSLGLSNALLNIGVAFIAKGDISLAKSHFEESLNISRALGDLYTQYLNLNNLADNYHDLGQLGKALEFSLQALSIAKELDNPFDVADMETTVGFYYSELKNFKKAEEHIQKGLKIANEHQQKENIKRAFERMALLEEQRGNFKEALNWNKMAYAFKDSIFTSDLKNELGKLEARYELENQLRETKRIEEEKLRAEQEATDRRNSLQYYMIFFGLFILFALVMGLTKLQLSERVKEVIVLITVLLFFEFILVLTDPLVERYSNGVPVYKLAFNFTLALITLPLHNLLTRLLVRKKLLAANS